MYVSCAFRTNTHLFNEKLAFRRKSVFPQTLYSMLLHSYRDGVDSLLCASKKESRYRICSLNSVEIEALGRNMTVF